jgi:rubredoxin
LDQHGSISVEFDYRPAIEFDCPDCGHHVYLIGAARAPDRCSVCQWIVDYLPPEERDAVRQRLTGCGE